MLPGGFEASFTIDRPPPRENQRAARVRFSKTGGTPTAYFRATQSFRSWHLNAQREMSALEVPGVVFPYCVSVFVGRQGAVDTLAGIGDPVVDLLAQSGVVCNPRHIQSLAVWFADSSPIGAVKVPAGRMRIDVFSAEGER
jgi:hypothetical protein